MEGGTDDWYRKDQEGEAAEAVHELGVRHAEPHVVLAPTAIHRVVESDPEGEGGHESDVVQKEPLSRMRVGSCKYSIKEKGSCQYSIIL